jgi:hypothetical protein
MDYVISIDDVKLENILYKYPVRNQNKKYINYYKVIYSNSFFSLKYIIVNIDFTFYNILCRNRHFFLEIQKCDMFYERVKYIEGVVLTGISCRLQKQISYTCYEELYSKNYIYCFKSVPNIRNLCLKISGIWEDHTHVGIVYKLLYNTSTEKLSKISC